MKEWRHWKNGAFTCALVGVSALIGYLAAGLVSGLLIIVPIELFTGSSAIEREWDGMIYALMIVIVPGSVNRLVKARHFDERLD